MSVFKRSDIHDAGMAQRSPGDSDRITVQIIVDHLVSVEMPPPSRDPREWPALLELDIAPDTERRVDRDG